jgi:hypothetical protein
MAKASTATATAKTNSTPAAVTDEVNRIIKKPHASLTAEEIETLITACETNEAGEIEMHLGFAFRDQKNIITEAHKEHFLAAVKSPLLAHFILIYHDLTIPQIQAFTSRLKDPIVAKTCEKKLTAKLTGCTMESLKPLATAAAAEADANK